MYSLVVTLALFGQAEIGVPPAPAPAAEIPATPLPVANPAANSAEEMRVWLLARLVIDASFDEKKSAEAQRLLANMNEPQLIALVAAYKERAAAPRPAVKPLVGVAPSPGSDQATDQAKLNLQQLEAYRDHLKREYDRRILQGHMTQNLVAQNILNNQTMMYRPYGMYGYGSGFGPLGYGGLGYGAMNYGGMGYGAMGYGGMGYSGMGYVSPMYGGGLGMW